MPIHGQICSCRRYRNSFRGCRSTLFRYGAPISPLISRFPPLNESSTKTSDVSRGCRYFSTIGRQSDDVSLTPMRGDLWRVINRPPTYLISRERKIIIASFDTPVFIQLLVLVYFQPAKVSFIYDLFFCNNCDNYCFFKCCQSFSCATP